MALPPVSCIMPTCNRRRFVPQAIKYFLEQDYPHKELIIVDDGSDPIGDDVPNNPQIRYFALPKKLSTGAKRNFAIEQSRAEIILHWDDDDWHAPYRISYQVEELIKNGVEICGIHKLLHFDLRFQRFWLYEYPVHRKMWLAGPALCYQKSFWAKNKFEDVSIGEDTRFVWKNKLDNALILPDFKFYVAMIHGSNTSPKSLSPPYWKGWHQDEVHCLLSNDWAFYSGFRQA